MSLFLAAILSCPALPPVPAGVADPLAEELSRFPAMEACEYWMDWGFQYLRWIDAHMIFVEDRNELIQWLSYRYQVENRLACWQRLMFVRSACHEWDSLWQRQEWMKELRNRLGDEQFALGYLPPPFDLDRMYKR